MPRAEHRHPLGRRAGVLAARRIDMGPGDAGAAGRHQSPGADHDHAAPALGSQTNPRRGEHGSDNRHYLRQPGALAEGVSLANCQPV